MSLKGFWLNLRWLGALETSHVINNNHISPVSDKTSFAISGWECLKPFVKYCNNVVIVVVVSCGTVFSVIQSLRLQRYDFI